MKRCRMGVALLALAMTPACSLFGGQRAASVESACLDEAAVAAYARARQALAAGDDAGALPDLELCCRKCPELVRAHVDYQDCAKRLGGVSAQAMAAFYQGPTASRSPVRAYLQARLAETAYAQSSALDVILRADPKFGWAHLSRARVNRGQGRLLAALDMYALAIANDATLFEAAVERAMVLADLGRYEEAAVGFKAYLAGRPDDIAAAREYVGLLLYRLGRIDEAFVWLDRLQQALPNDPLVRMDRAAALWRANRAREAVDTYLGILAEQPNMARAAWNVGLLYFEVVPQDDAQRRLFWPHARAAFEYFMQHSQPVDGDEQFERTLGVPYRLERIAGLLGASSGQPVDLAALRWPRAP